MSDLDDIFGTLPMSPTAGSPAAAAAAATGGDEEWGDFDDFASERASTPKPSTDEGDDWGTTAT